MSVEIELNGFEATVTNGVWDSDDAIFLRILQTVTSRKVPGESSYVPDEDHNLALRAVSRLKGCRITHIDPIVYTLPPDTVY